MTTEILIDDVTLNELVHDRWWFDVEQSVFDREQQEFRLYVGVKRKGPYNDKLLRITGVQDMAIDDQAQIGVYSIHTIELGTGWVTINSFIPLKITLKVTGSAKILVIDRTRPS